MTAPARFKQADLRRAVKAVEGMGFQEIRVCIGPDGKIEVIVRKAVADDDAEELD